MAKFKETRSISNLPSTGEEIDADDKLKKGLGLLELGDDTDTLAKPESKIENNINFIAEINAVVEDAEKRTFPIEKLDNGSVVKLKNSGRIVVLGDCWYPDKKDKKPQRRITYLGKNDIGTDLVGLEDEVILLKEVVIRQD